MAQFVTVLLRRLMVWQCSEPPPPPSPAPPWEGVLFYWPPQHWVVPCAPVTQQQALEREKRSLWLIGIVCFSMLPQRSSSIFSNGNGHGHLKCHWGSYQSGCCVVEVHCNIIEFNQIFKKNSGEDGVTDDGRRNVICCTIHFFFYFITVENKTSSRRKSHCITACVVLEKHLLLPSHNNRIGRWKSHSEV